MPLAHGAAPALVPRGPEARTALEVTFREALRLGHHDVGTEHVLLAVLETDPTTASSLGARIVAQLGALPT